MSELHQQYMFRCLELARHGTGRVAPNPMVGAVLVYENRIIGEGYHQVYGGPHAEVNCIRSVDESDAHLIPLSTLYVSLEPCAHFGKTPPCSQLIIDQKIPKVVIGCRDPFAAVNGKGIEQLQKAGVAVSIGILEKEAIALNQRFFCFHQQRRPYVILKWAQTADRFIAGTSTDRLLITHEQTNRIVHRWRSEEDAILIGTETALKDDPSLNNRYWTGGSPLRLVIDKKLRLPHQLVLFNDGEPLVIFNELKNEKNGPITYVKLAEGKTLIDEIFDYCYANGIQSILVEGGARLLQYFIDQHQWDEARIITNKELHTQTGLAAPVLSHHIETGFADSSHDQINFYMNSKHTQVL